VPYVTVDGFHQQSALAVASQSGNGPSLVRINASAYGDDRSTGKERQ
jgi:hypothetical protein